MTWASSARRPLAIAAPSFSEVSETFIRDHVCAIMPKATVVIAQQADGATEMGVPALAPCPSWEPPLTFVDRVLKSAEARFRKHIRPNLRRADLDRAAAFLTEHRPAALLVEYLDYALNFIRLAEMTETALYAHGHGYDVGRIEHEAVIRRNAQRLFRTARGIFVPSAFLASRLIALGCPRDKITVSPYGVDPDRLTPTSAEPMRLLAVGRLVDKKAPHLTLEAFARVTKRFPAAHLDLVGDGPLMARCCRLVQDLGIAGQVVLHGARPHEEVMRLMSATSLFLQHSVTADSGDTEGLPVAILEAMSSAVPIVATRHAGIPDAVVDGETGLLVEEHDVAGMAEAMSALLTDRACAQAMGKAGRRRVLKHYTEAHAAERLRAAMGLAEPLEVGA